MDINDGDGKGKLREGLTLPRMPTCDICRQVAFAIDDGAQFRCRNCDDEWTIHITSHAWDQWNERSQDPDTHPIQAYKRAIEFLSEGTRIKGDEIRYDHESRTVPIRKQDKVVTFDPVLDARTPIQRAAVRSMIREGGMTSEIAELCRECSITTSELKGIVRFERGITNADALVDERADPEDEISAGIADTKRSEEQQKR